ncbi:MAG: hypothetical protein Q9162_003353, partial [Coniocarpon cinnabarinum]
MARGHRSQSRLSDAESNDISSKDWEGTRSQQLPALPAFTPDKYVRSHDEYQINTSALRRAFPEFSQHGSSDEDSIEVGRGLGNGNRDPARFFPSEDPSENISLNFDNGEKYTVTATPPLKPKNIRAPAASQNTATKDLPMPRSISEKENQDPEGKVTSFGSRSSSDRDTVQRKSTAVHQSVEQDESQSMPTRPKSHYASAKSTRFTSPPARQPLTETKNSVNRQTSGTAHNGTVDSVNSAAAGTYQSFVLPDMPNMTELMTGSRRDAKPNMARRTQGRSQFGTPSSLRNPVKSRPTHEELGDVPVPADAKALYLSLQLLQEKVQTLEGERDRAVEKADGYELELLRLRSQVEEQAETVNNDQDSKWVTERAKFEKSVKTLQQRLKQTTKKYNAAEATIKSLTSSRGNAQEELSAAQNASDALQNDCIALRQELRAVKNQLTSLNQHHDELQGKVERREKAVHELASMAKQLWDTRRALARSNSKLEQRNISRNRASVRSQKASAGVSEQAPGLTAADETTKKARPRRSNLDDSMTVEQTTRQSSKQQSVLQQAHVQTDTRYFNLEDLERCETYLSFMDGDEVAKLRQVLQEDKARLQSEGLFALPRKSSMKDTTRQSSRKGQQVQYEDLSDQICQEITDNVSRPLSRNSVRSHQSHRVRDDDAFSRDVDIEPDVTREMTQQSLRNPRSRPPRSTGPVNADAHDENMTSAFILPDITMTGAALASAVNGKSNNVGHDFKKHKGIIPRPVPVSERPVSPTPENPDPTLRPSREPGVALSLVLHSLEAEITRLREQLSKFEDLYQQADPSLSKRRRKAIWARILRIGEAIERRADQVYALYDVLEGLKQSGLEMKEEEVEVTLAELGVDAAYVQRATSTKAGAKETKKQGGEQDEIAGLPFEGDDEEISDVDGEVWEGFETTGTHTGGV